MSFGSFSEGGVTQPMSEINTTPMVDVMLVLLVIFIITAPLFHQAVSIDLPQADASRIDDKPRTIQLALDASGVIFLDGTAVTRPALDAALRAEASANPELHLRADRATRYDKLADIMAAAQRAGIRRIAFVTEPAKP